MKKEISDKWSIVLSFCLGAFIAEISSDPTDFFFFLRSSSTTPLSPVEQVIYWYFLTAFFYLLIFAIALIGAYTDWYKPVHIIYLLIFLTLLGFVESIVLNNSFDYVSLILICTLISVFVLVELRNKVRESKKEKWFENLRSDN